MGMNTPNGPFYLPEPEPDDERPRNAFGFLIGFGKAYAEYYARQEQGHTDEEKQEQIPKANQKAAGSLQRCPP